VKFIRKNELPVLVKIEVEIKTPEQAGAMVAGLIELERSLRGRSDTGNIRSDEIARVRRNLQERAGLVVVPEN
jgi:hypothetical protein